MNNTVICFGLITYEMFDILKCLIFLYWVGTLDVTFIFLTFEFLEIMGI